MAEEILRLLAGDKFDVEGAGIEPGVLNPLVVKVLEELDIDISQKKTKSVFDLLNSERAFDYIITVCDETSAEQCPVFPGIKGQIHWSFEDPSKFEGTEEEKLAKVRIVRDKIKSKIEEWLNKGQ